MNYQQNNVGQTLYQLGNAIVVSPRQKGNPVLKFIRNVHWQYGDILPDYMLGQSIVGLFLSLRYHLLKPEYIHGRMKALRASGYRNRVLIVQVDTEDATVPLAQVTKAAISNEFTLFCGFNAAECARYIETLKSYEKKPAESIQKDLGSDYASRASSVLTSVRGVNKTDAKTLGDEFESLAGIFSASLEEVQGCAGIGPTKARRLHEAYGVMLRFTNPEMYSLPLLIRMSPQMIQDHALLDLEVLWTEIQPLRIV
ncbi:hypothetical protein M9435_003236 [Picochlorum sp. BPE23]|nr:hypothetical protein M9435_003236 [Picochlorum sp. BPE23]